ncbi:MAG: Tol-pal system beta propeller repeat protein [Acidimicrobiales bacterium]|nr:Tol-pal system beta propeller repeat protein [Acidimicrobiales bacterium]
MSWAGSTPGHTQAVRRGMAVVVALLAVAACSNGGAAPATSVAAPAAVSRAGTIVFEGGTASAERLYAVSPASGRERRLAVDAASFEPQLSPDGRSVAFSRPRPAQPSVSDVYVEAIAGGAGRLVTTGRCPTWSRDGRTLLVSTAIGLRRVSVSGTASSVVPGAGTRCALEVAPDRLVLWDQQERLDLLVAGKATPLVTMAGCTLGPVALDPAATRVAFTAACPRETGGLYVANLAAARPMQVLAGVAYGAAWSPDGTTLASAFRPNPNAEHQLWLITADGSARRRIAGDIVNAPTWGPSPR